MPTDQQVNDWADEIGAVSDRIGKRFSRSQLRVHSEQYLQGLISRVERKNGWQLAEELGEQTPTNLQHFIARSRWNADEVRDDLQQYVVDHLGKPEGALIVDETGFLKKGKKSVGVKRQYSGTAGRIENCQIGVFLAYRSDAGQALIDRSLYLPKEWSDDAERRAEAKVPEEMDFATKPALAREMLARLESRCPGRLGDGRRSLRFGPQIQAFLRRSRTALRRRHLLADAFISQWAKNACRRAHRSVEAVRLASTLLWGRPERRTSLRLGLILVAWFPGRS